MRTVNGLGINQVYVEALWEMRVSGVPSNSRNGGVRVHPTPVTSAYRDPRQRMLFDAKRDANPFFHIVEAAWMLAGENRYMPIARYNPRMAEFSDDGVTLNGAYGTRWRRHFGLDQIRWVVRHLAANPESRRAHIVMWDPAQDPYSIDHGALDVPCNTSIDFCPRLGCLDMTVYNRSNDIIWGCYGANVVHMSVLHELVALAAGFKLGTYYQVSNNWHVYERHYDLVDSAGTYAEPTLYDGDGWFHLPLCAPGIEPALELMNELEEFIDAEENGTSHEQSYYTNQWIRHVLIPLTEAWTLFKGLGAVAAISKCNSIQDSAIREACKQWLSRRIK